MTRKENLLKEVYLLKNRIAQIDGTAQTDVEQIARTGKFACEAKNARVSDLEFRIDTLKGQYRKAVEKKEREERNASYFATPEGAARKQTIEKEIDAARQEWDRSERRLVADMEERIRQTLGEQWGVSRYTKGCLVIGVIDPEKSTTEQREFFFGQTIAISYDMRPWGEGQERFETNVGTCGSCSMTGGRTVGERAFFYVGIGKLFADQELVEYLRTTIRDAAESFDKAVEKVCGLEAELQNPLKETAVR